jgi:hypothetical protein
MTNDFSRYLKELDSREKLEKETAENMAIGNYTEWASHFELLKRNFQETDELFNEIGRTVTNWKPGDYSRGGWGSLGWDSEYGYFFSTSIERIDPATKVEDKTISLRFSLEENHRRGIGDERSIYIPNSEVKAELVGLDRLKTADRFTESNTRLLLSKLDDCILRVDVAPSRHNSYSVRRKVGYLYEHNLADDCRQLFMKMNEEKISQDVIETIFPPGDYTRRTGNILLQNDNDIVHAEDPKWRNE